jgi:hypothetical protein
LIGFLREQIRMKEAEIVDAADIASVSKPVWVRGQGQNYRPALSPTCSNFGKRTSGLDRNRTT